MPDGKITGIVKDENDQVRPGATVSAFFAGNLQGQDTTGPAGEFEITNLEIGKKYTLRVEHQGKVRRTEEVEIPAGGAAQRNNLKFDPAAQPAGAPAGKFNDLSDLVRTRQDDFARNADVNISEAQYFRQLYMVGNYVLARVIDSLNALQDAEERVSMDATQWETWWGQNSLAVLELQRQVSEEPLTLARLMRQVRAAFDLGTEPADRVNTEFKEVFKEFIALCADDLLAIDVATAENQGGWEETKTQEVVSHYRRVKRALIRLTELMSRVGRPDMANNVNKWSGIIAETLEYLHEAGKNASGDIDDKHIWGFVSNLNGINKSEIDPFIEHAPKGTKLMGDTLQTYQLLNGDRETYTKEHLRALFHEQKIDTYKSDGQPERGSPGIVLHENASVLLEYWPANWG